MMTNKVSINSKSNIEEFIALLPIKAHSERIKNKNFKKLGNIPLFEWILNTLISIEEIDKIIINTDSEKILKKNDLPRKVIVRERGKKLQGDFVSMNKIIEDDLNNSNGKYYLMTHATNPFLKSSTIINALREFRIQLNEKKCDSLFSVNKFQSRFFDKYHYPINHNPNRLIRTQDLDPIYEENSCFYFFTKESFKLTKNRIGLNPNIFETPKIESIDIDDKEDWSLAEAVASYNKTQN